MANKGSIKRFKKLGVLTEGAKEKAYDIGFGIDTSVFKPKPIQDAENKINLLSVGALSKTKGHDIILKGVSEMISRGYDIGVTIVGRGGEEWIAKIAEQYGVKDRIKYEGTVDHKELSGLYNKADVFVLANRYEVTPAVGEAMACGTPIICMECGGLEDWVEDCKTGLTFEYENTLGMVQKVIELLRNDNLRRTLKSNAMKMVRNRYSLSSVAEKYYKAYTN